MCLRDEEESSVLTAQHSRAEKSSFFAGWPSFTKTWEFDTVLFMYLSSVKRKKDYFFPDLTLWPFNLYISSKYSSFCIRDCPRNHVFVTSENTLHLPIFLKIATFLWNESQMITRMFLTQFILFSFYLTLSLTTGKNTCLQTITQNFI